MRTAVLFPGIGYHCDKPLLYYAAKVARAAGYEIVPVPYTGFPPNVRGDADKLAQCVDIAWTQANRMLSRVRWEETSDILFIGKSIGTVVAAWYARERALSVRSVLLTPLAGTFQYVDGDAIAFFGTADPWTETAVIQNACAARNIPLYLTEHANHSLETGNVSTDLEALKATMARIEAFVAGSACRDAD